MINGFRNLPMYRKYLPGYQISFVFMKAKKITIRRLKKLIEKKKGITLVDVLAEEIYEKIHIKGSINIPYTRLDHDAFTKLDPRKIIITYSIDYECPVGRLAALKLREFGFRKVYYYPGGLKEWLEADLPVVRSESIAAGGN